MDMEERLLRFCMELECWRCGNPIFDDEDDAREELRCLRSISEFEPNLSDAELRDDLTSELSWMPRGGNTCPWCCHILGKDC